MNTATVKKKKRKQPREQLSPAYCQSSSIWRLQPAQAAAGIRQLPTSCRTPPHLPALGHRALQAWCSSNKHHLRSHRTLRKVSENVKPQWWGKMTGSIPRPAISALHWASNQLPLTEEALLCEGDAKTEGRSVGQ